MSDETTEQAAPVENAETPAPVDAPNTPPPIDPTALYSKARRDGVDTATKQHTAFLVETFGTSDPVKLAELAKGEKAPATTPELEKTMQMVKDLTGKLDTLNSEKESLSLQMAQQSRVQNAKSPLALKTILDHVNGKYDFKQEGLNLVAYTKDGAPEFDKTTGNVQTFEQVLEGLKADDETSFLFSETTPKDPLATPEAGTGATPEGLTKLTREQRSDPRLYAFAQRTNQGSAFMNGNAINMAGFEAFAAERLKKV